MTSTATHRFTLPFLFALLAGSLAAQGAPIYPTSHSYSLGSPVGVLGRTVTGDISSDLLPDLAIRSGTSAFMLVNPGCLQKVVTVPSTMPPSSRPIRDIAMIPGVPSAGSSRLAVATTLGVTLLSYNLFAAPGTRWSGVLMSDPDAAGAALLRTGDVDASGTEDLIVVRSDKRTLRYELHQGNAVFTTMAGFTMSQDVLDVAALELDGLPGNELAILATDGLHIRRPDGTFVAFVHNAFPGEDAMCVVPNIGSPGKVFYTTIAADGATHTLLQVGVGNPNWVEGSWNLGVIHPVSLQAADYDHDGDPDILLTETDPGTLKILLHHLVTGQVTFSTVLAPENIVIVNVLPASTPGNAANARWVDANLDGKLDLFLGVTAGSEVRGLIAEGPAQSLAHHPLFKQVNYDEIGTLEIELVRDDPEPHNRLEVVVWTQQLNQAPELRTGPVYTDLPQVGQLMTVTVAMNGPDKVMPFGSQMRYYITVRKVTIPPPTSSISASGPVYVSGFCGGKNLEQPPEATENVALRADSDPTYQDIPYTYMRTAHHIYGMYVAMPRVPPFVPTGD